MEMQRELGVPFRDLMILDPALPTRYPSSVFIRPRALVINLEHIRAVVVSTRVVLMADRDDGGPDPHAKSFFQSLRKMLAKDPTPTPTDVLPETLPDDVIPDDVIPDDVIPDDVLPDDVIPNGGVSPEATAATTDILGLRQSPADLKVLALPFELRVVEAALFHVCARLLEETIELEDAAYPALDSLARHVTTKSLERVRRAKAAMNQLSRRVGAVREELSKLLADDGDMMAMCLTTREEKDRHVHDDGRNRHYRSGGEEESITAPRPITAPDASRGTVSSGPRVRRRSSSSASSSTVRASERVRFHGPAGAGASAVPGGGRRGSRGAPPTAGLVPGSIHVAHQARAAKEPLRGILLRRRPLRRSLVVGG